MADLAAYFDDSEKAGVVTFAGYIGWVEQWKRFDEEWQEMLKKENLLFFHTADCLAGKGQFVEWPHKRRYRAIERAASIIYFRIRSAFSYSVDARDFHAVINSPEAKEFFGNPLSFCVAGCLREIEYWKDNLGISNSIDYFFERGGKYGKATSNLIKIFSKAMYKARINMDKPWNFGNKRDYSALQAADLLAYASTRYWAKDRSPLTVELGKIIRDAMRFQAIGKFISRNSLEKMLAISPVSLK